MDIDALLERPFARPTLVVVAVLLGLHLIALLTLVSLRAATGEVVLVGTSVDGEDVSGLTREELDATVSDRGDELLARPIEVDADGETLSTDRAEVGVDAGLAATAEEAWSRGRSGFYTAVAEQVAARFGSEHDARVPLSLDEDRLRTWADGAAEELSVEPDPATVTLAADEDGPTDLEVTEPSEGTAVDPDELFDEVADRYQEPGLLEIDVDVEVVPEPTSDADVDAVLADAETALADDVVLENPSAGADLALEPPDLAEVLEVVFAEDAAEGQRLQLSSDGARVRDHLGEDALEELDADPVDASLELVDGEAVVEGGTVSMEADLEAVADRIVALSSEEPADPEEEDGENDEGSPEDGDENGDNGETDENGDNDETGENAPEADGDEDREPRRDELPGETEEPERTAAAAEEALAESGLDVSEEVVLENPSAGEDLVLGPEELTSVLEAELVDDEDEGLQVELEADEDDFEDALGGVLDAAQPGPVDASVSLVGGTIERSGSTPGFEVDLGEMAGLIVELATSDERTEELPGEQVEPDFTDELAQTVQEEVSSFTTPLTPGQPRNRNIRRAAEIIDGDVVLPGERYSLNEGIGRRTSERGFGENGFIREGELVSVTGGGVSQIGTTFMNAAWFAGIELVTFQPHSFYFSHYPEGREATLSWNTIDVVIENDSPYAILISTSSSESQVTISFWSTEWAEVDTFTGDRTNVRSGRVRDGFDISFGRTITTPDGETRTENYSHSYVPED